LKACETSTVKANSNRRKFRELCYGSSAADNVAEVDRFVIKVIMAYRLDGRGAELFEFQACPSR
jgi:hypothetical protein